ncbi:helix-turn-helix domain-containing protein [Kineosporia sp. J2-2]|uniref:Helix-turn-helix domain-containing protein n=1 Tax=Kineosporia corallincola TaxID=2835133 RepID=A0ABS5TEY6_9ACTN|nr:helix-turn-helix transcriptional regulator [Kineosporia corallincola]MBT0769653.1 helix-turn-helix domain-containing protein [Kineosporia corallincola]
MATEAGKHERPPSLAQRRVGQRLKGWRERARKTQEDAAAALLVHHTKIYRIESGRTLAKPGDIRELSRIYDIPFPQTEELIHLSRSALKPGIVDSYRDVVSGDLGLLADLEAACSEMRAWDGDLVHGLLQTPAYALAILGTLPDVSDEVRRKRLKFRLERQRVLMSSDPHCDIRIVLGESALRYVVGSDDVMRDQIGHLVELSNEIDIRVRPFSVGPHPWIAGGVFTMLDFPDAADPAVVYTESHLDSRYMETARELAEYRKIFGELYGTSIPVKEFVR